MKFVKIGYGSEGQGVSPSKDGYTYVVNDNVRVKQKVSPVVKHYKSQNLFSTTGVVLSTSKKAEAFKVDEKGNKTPVEKVTQLVTAAGIGLQSQRGIGGRFEGSTRDDFGNYVANEREKITRGVNLRMAQLDGIGESVSPTQKQQEAQSSYDEYAKQFMGGNQ